MPKKLPTTTKSPIDLQQAKADAALRYERIGLAMLAEAGVETWEFHTKGLFGHALPRSKHVVCPKPTTRRRLYVLAHECGHVALKHVRSKPRHREEYEAERYAHETLRRHGVSVPKKESVRAKRDVALTVDKAVRLGRAKQLDREAVRWCQTHHQPATTSALRAGRVKLADLS